MISLFLAANFYIMEPVVDMREQPSSTSEIVSQAVFAENIKVEKYEGDWVYVVTQDQYLGWIPSSSFTCLDETYEGDFMVSRIKAHVYEISSVKYGPFKTLPYGSKILGQDDQDPRWLKIVLPDGKEGYIQKGDVALEPEWKSKADLVALSYKFLGLPYTWGGRSSLGYDCSGFVQMLYSKIGINLQRDSKQQVLDNRFLTVSANDIQPGDLIFFGKSQQEIYHVGMSTGNGRFIHATVKENQPWIRISKLTDLEWSGTSESGYPFRMVRQLRVD